MVHNSKEMATTTFLDKDPHDNIFGVLLSDEIDFYCDKHEMIVPYNKEDNLQPASYDVSLGKKYQRNGERFELTDKNPSLKLKPHEAVVISTKEKLTMPRFLIGRWNPRVTTLFDGIVWVGGVHIDPGFEGNLFVPIYNLSREPVVLQLGQRIASIDFVKTTKFSGKCKEYENKPKDQLTHPGSGLEDIRDEIKDFPKKIENYQSINLTVLSIIIAAISIIAILPFAVAGKGLEFPSVDIYIITFAVSIVAIVMAAISIWITRMKIKQRL